MTGCDKFEQAILEFGVKSAIEYFDAPDYMEKHLDSAWEKQVRESEISVKQKEIMCIKTLREGYARLAKMYEGGDIESFCLQILDHTKEYEDRAIIQQKLQPDNAEEDEPVMYQRYDKY